MDGPISSSYIHSDLSYDAKSSVNHDFDSEQTVSHHDEANDNVLAARFNQDSTCLAVSNKTMLSIYNCNPFCCACERNLEDKVRGGIHSVEMMYRCNIIAIVGAAAPSYSDEALKKDDAVVWQRNVLIIWDDKKGCEVAQLVFGGPIKNVRLLRKIMVIVLDKVIYVYTLETVELLYTITSGYNPQGLCAVATNGNLNVVTYPEVDKGCVGVRIYQLNPVTDVVEASECLIIKAHRSTICCLSLCFNGILLATASSGSQYLRLWNLFTGQKLQELRMYPRGSHITFCQISQDTRYLLTICEDQVVSIFKVQLKSNFDDRGVRCMDDCRSYGGYLMKKIVQSALLYLDAPRAFIKYNAKSPIIACTFLPNTNNVLLVLTDRTVLRLGIAAKIKLLAKHRL